MGQNFVGAGSGRFQDQALARWSGRPGAPRASMSETDRYKWASWETWQSMSPANFGHQMMWKPYSNANWGTKSSAIKTPQNVQKHKHL